MPKGLKSCPNCGLNVGVRVKLCLECGHTFLFKPSVWREKSKYVKDWKELQKGDIIRSVNGTGSYWLVENEEEKVYLGQKGKLTVQQVVHNGIHVTGKYGFSFVYMGESSICKKTGVHREPHKLKLIKKSK